VDKQGILSSLPSVDEVLKSERGVQWQGAFPRCYVVRAIREVIEAQRKAILAGNSGETSGEVLLDRIGDRARELSEFSLRPVINATGVVIHTNLGRAVLSEETMRHVTRVACSYSNLEYDLGQGRRGKRYSHVQRLLRDITGAEDALVVNNNAAAVFVSLNTLAKGREVIVSRGELVEIGGSFRIPEVMSNSGAVLREVGTTNKTHGYDYERAIGDQTALLLKVHQSNFRISGFAETPSIESLVAIGRQRGVPVMFDLGSGCLFDLRPFGVHIEPTVQEVVKSGADLVTFSGDKLLGGPQAGVIVGKAAHIDRISRNPLLRAVRVDKLTLSAFEATLRQYLEPEKAREAIPVLRLLLQDPEEIRSRARRLSTLLKKRLDSSGAETVEIRVIRDVSQAGGGSLPEVPFDTFAVALKPRQPSGLSVKDLEGRLRRNRPPIIARIKEDWLLLDLRTLSQRDFDPLVDGVKAALAVT